MKNSGVIVANDASKERLKALIGNIHRLGILCYFFTLIFLSSFHRLRFNLSGWSAAYYT